MVFVRTCGIVLENNKGHPVLCLKPAAFRYSGLVPKKIKGSDQTYATRAKERVTIDTCMDHTRRIFITMEPAFRDGEVRMRCLLQTKLTIHCKVCSSVFRFEPLPPTTLKMPGRFCPNCGAGSNKGDVLTSIDPQLDYWDLVSQEIGLEGDPQLT